MTFAEVKGAVIDLGFDTSVEYENALVSATNRAMAQINRLRPALGELTLDVRRPILTLGHAKATDSDEFTLTLQGATAYSFFAQGHGTYKDSKGNKGDIAALSRKAFRILIDKGLASDVTVTFKSDGRPFTVQYFAAWDAGFGDKPDAIPMYGDCVEYNLKGLADDYLSISEPPMTSLGVQLTPWRMNAARSALLLDPELCGSVTVVYHRRLVEARLEDFTGEVDVSLDPDVQDLLPLLVASYIWMDDEPQKATYYKQLYDQQVQFLLLEKRLPRFSQTVRRKGW